MLRGTGSIPARNKLFVRRTKYGVQVIVPGLAVCVCDFSVYKRTHDTGIIPSKNQKRGAKIIYLHL